MILLSFQRISFDGFYFVYFLFFLHICTAFLTTINAFDNDLYHKEEIIQLSIDSIHIVKSTESPFLNLDDHEEKELLLALLTSYTDAEVLIIDNEIPIVNTPSSIRFLPSSLHFPEQSIAIPRMQTVIIINDDPEPLEVYSLTGTTDEFYSSAFKSTILSPDGGNMTISIYYFPRTIGLKESLFTIKTNRGNFSYDISGIARPNPFRLRPLINIEIPLNSTYEYILEFYNPYNYSLSINEIYTSDENLIIELLTNQKQKNHLKKISQYHEQWSLKPYETKSIVKINYFAYKLNQLSGLICIKTNFSETIILPVEIHVLNRSGLYSNLDLLKFPMEGFLRSIKTPVYVFNHGLDPVIITDVRVSPEHRDFMTVRYKNLPIPPDIYRLNQIADITIDLNSIPHDIEHLHGYVRVYTSMNDEEPVLKIPYDERIVHGSLDFKKEETYFYISNNQSIEQCRSIRLFNQYNIPIAVSNITINKFELLSRYIQIKYPASFFYIYPDQWTDLLCITSLQQPSLSATFNSIQAVIDIHTNLSHFSLPLHLYNGFLHLDLLNGGIQQNENNPLELLITSIPVNRSRTVRFILTNANPIDIQIEYFHCNADIRLDYLKLLDGNQTKIPIENRENLSQIVIPKRHQAIFSLTIHGTNPPDHYIESMTIQTSYQTLQININYEITNGSLELSDQTPIHIDVFPNHVATADIFLLNKFDEPINITRIHFTTYGLCFSFTRSNTSIDRMSLEPNKVQRIGSIHFDMAPLCKSILVPSESTCYCGLNHHPELKHEWKESISVLNTHKLDQILVEKFRNLWKEWTSILRKQRIQTNVWLYTNRANISWPMTIGFIWPSVLEQSSSSAIPTLITIDFQVTFINITKFRNVIIKNPSSDLLTYSVTLLNNSSFTNDQIFSISTAFKPIVFENGIYHFHLLPNEQMTFDVSYRPTLPIKHETYLIIRNNLTIIESVLLRGEGGTGGLQVGSSAIPIVLEISADQHKLCSNPDGNPVLQKTLTLRNTGNMQTIISDISFGHLKCSGQGFSVSVCRDIELKPHGKYDLKILFQPNYTSDEITETLLLNTTIGLMIFPIIVRIPQQILSACYQTISRPPWEWQSFCLCSCTLILFILLIYVAAVFNAQRLFHDYLVRADWRNQIQTANEKMFDLRDLSAAIQDEQKPREQVESNPIADVKKEIKHKRSTNVNPTRTTENSHGANRSATVNVKELPPKPRRATTDEGVPKSSKHSIEPPTKPLPSLRRMKSDQQATSNPPRPLSSSTLSEEENEPFILARSKRVLSKRKGSFSNTSPKPMTENIPPVVQISSRHSDPPDRTQLDDSTNDQQWHRVSFNKGQRKGHTPRRETSEESQTTKQTLKIPLTDPENPVILTSSAHTHSAISHKSIQSRRHRQNPSSTLVPISRKRKSLQNNTLLLAADREQAFRQLTEQLWAAGLPSSTTACSMSTRSRCSSAPPSERGGGDELNGKKNDNEENIHWDEPDMPDEGNNRCLNFCFAY